MSSSLSLASHAFNRIAKHCQVSISRFEFHECAEFGSAMAPLKWRIGMAEATPLQNNYRSAISAGCEASPLQLS